MSFNTGYNRIMGYDMPLFLYCEYKYDPEDPEKGLFRSSFLVCVSEYMRGFLYNAEACVV